jgi:hypothetical protein
VLCERLVMLGSVLRTDRRAPDAQERLGDMVSYSEPHTREHVQVVRSSRNDLLFLRLLAELLPSAGVASASVATTRSRVSRLVHERTGLANLRVPEVKGTSRS